MDFKVTRRFVSLTEELNDYIYLLWKSTTKVNRKYIKLYESYKKYDASMIISEIEILFHGDKEQNAYVYSVWKKVFGNPRWLSCSMGFLKYLNPFLKEPKQEFVITNPKHFAVSVFLTITKNRTDLMDSLQKLLNEYSIKDGLPFLGFRDGLNEENPNTSGMYGFKYVYPKSESDILNENPEVKKQLCLSCSLSEDEAKKLLPLLKEKGFVADDTKEEDWLSAFGFRSEPMSKRIVWSDTQPLNRGIQKKSLFGLLKMMGVEWEEVKGQGTKRFFVADGEKDFVPQDVPSENKWKHNGFQTNRDKLLSELIETAKA